MEDRDGDFAISPEAHTFRAEPLLFITFLLSREKVINGSAVSFICLKIDLLYPVKWLKLTRDA